MKDLKEKIYELIDVSSSIKASIKTNQFGDLLSNIETWQTLANRLESALYDKSDYKYSVEEAKKLKQEIKKLKEEKEAIENES